MEKETQHVEEKQCKAYALFEQPETLKILSFLDASEKKITYKGIADDPGRKHKDFTFEAVSFLTEKLVLLS